MSTLTAGRARRDERAFRLIYAVSFLLFLLVAIFARLLPRPWRPRLLGASGRSSVVGEAKTMANLATPYAFTR